MRKQSKWSMVLAAVLCGFASFVFADSVTNTYALVAGWGNTVVNLYRVKDEGTTWSLLRTVRAVSDGNTTHVSDAVYKDGVVYVADMINEAVASVRYIRKYSVKGGYLGDLVCLGAAKEVGCLCLSSDGESLYAGYTFRDAGGTIDKISLADGTVTQLATGCGAIRQIAVDGKGHLFAAARDGQLKIVSEATGAILTSIGAEANAAQGVAYDPQSDSVWCTPMNQSRATQVQYDADKNTAKVLASYTDGTWGGHCFAIATLDGLPYFGSFSDKCIHRRSAEGTYAKVKDESGVDITYPTSICGLMFIREVIEVKDVARVHVTVPMVGVKSYLVDSANNWRFEKQVISKTSEADDELVRPVTVIGLNGFFYGLDQYQDADRGYFSLATYDRYGAFRGKLVQKAPVKTAADANSKVDHLALSKDGKTFYASSWGAGKAFKIDAATGAVSDFTVEGVISTGSASRGIDTDRDGNVYICHRSLNKVSVYSSAGDELSRTYGQQLVSSVFVDDDDNKVYLNSTTSLCFYEKGTSQHSDIGNQTGFATIAKVKTGSAIEDILVVGNWAGTIYTLPSAPAPSALLAEKFTGVGNIQHIDVEPIDACPAGLAPSAEKSAFVVCGGAYYVAADDGLAVDAEGQKTTVWKSEDDGATWSVQAELENVAAPTLFADGSTLCLFGEILPANGVRRVSVRTLGAGGWTEKSSADLPEAASNAVFASGNAVCVPFEGSASGFAIPYTKGTERTVGLATIAPGSADIAFSEAMSDVVESYFTGVANQPYRNTHSPFKASDSPVSCAWCGTGAITYMPCVIRRDAVAKRVAPEFVAVFTNGTATATPTYAGFARLPGGAKPFAVIWDEASACHWAVTTPETNEQALAKFDPTDTRNVLALYASEDGFDWRLAKVVRADVGATRGTLVFSRPSVQIAGEDLKIVYGVSGTPTETATPVAADGRIVISTVTGFRALKPSFGCEDVALLHPDYTSNAFADKWVVGDDGEWHTKGPFIPVPFLPISAVSSERGRIFVLGEMAGISVYSRKGRKLRMIAPPQGHHCDAAVVSADGQTLWITDCNTGSKSVWKLSLATGAWTELVDLTVAETDAKFVPRCLAVASDGSFYIGCRDTGAIRRYAADGSSYVVVTTIASAISLALDETAGKLFVGTRFGAVYKCDVACGYAQTLLLKGLSVLDNGCFSISLRDGLLYCVDGMTSALFTLDPDRELQDPNILLGAGLFSGRCTFFDGSDQGLLMFVR